MVKSWIHSSVATLEAHKMESAVETYCHKHKNNTVEVLLEWLLTTRMAATTPRISILTLSLLKIRAVFWMFPNVCVPISETWKKISTKSFHYCKVYLWKNLGLDYERYRTKLRYWKTVANEKCTAEKCELSSVKNLFWANHASEKARKSLKRKLFGWNSVPEKMNWFFAVILKNWGRNGQRTPKIA